MLIENVSSAGIDNYLIIHQLGMTFVKNKLLRLCEILY